MNKITPDHLTRSAYVYVRQSTPDQLANNPESRRRQYALADRARVLGWENVIVIDDDLGRSGGGTARPGFERLLAAICTGAAGAVLAIEASRLARNGRDWHTLLEFCTLVNSLIIDEDGVYDPKLINDRLLLGMKGTFSELELSILRQRSQEALRLKAARGDLHTSVAIGYVRGADDQLEIDPDKRVREALHLAFRKFAEFGSVRQVSMWLCDEGLKMPIVVYGPAGRMVEWQLPRYNTIHRLLTNPIYAGAYVYGRTGSKVRVEAGRKLITRSVRRPQQEWEVLIRDHHEAYISWEDYENNQRTINGNANMKGGLVPGSVRNGGGLLVGLLRCGHSCGSKAADQQRPVPEPYIRKTPESRPSRPRQRRGVVAGSVLSRGIHAAGPDRRHSFSVRAAGNRQYAAELVALAPDVILANGAAAVRSLQGITRTVPVVFAGVADPIGEGWKLRRTAADSIVDSLSRTGLARAPIRRQHAARSRCQPMPC